MRPGRCRGLKGRATRYRTCIRQKDKPPAGLTTSAGLSGVTGSDAGASSGVINTFHQVGSALGLSILVAVGAASVPAGAAPDQALLDRITAALTGSGCVQCRNDTDCTKIGMTHCKNDNTCM